MQFLSFGERSTDMQLSIVDDGLIRQIIMERRLVRSSNTVSMNTQERRLEKEGGKDTTYRRYILIKPLSCQQH